MHIQSTASIHPNTLPHSVSTVSLTWFHAAIYGADDVVDAPPLLVVVHHQTSEAAQGGGGGGNNQDENNYSIIQRLLSYIDSVTYTTLQQFITCDCLAFSVGLLTWCVVFVRGGVWEGV